MRIVLGMYGHPTSVILPGKSMFGHDKAANDWSSFVPSSSSGVRSKQRWLCHCFAQQISLDGASCDI
jgi:hypothetical protein